MEDTDNTDDIGLGSDVRLFVELDGTFFGELVDSFEELFSLHAVDGEDPREDFGREDRDSLEPEIVRTVCEGVSDSENSGVEDADDISGVSVLNNGSVLRHELLGLGEGDFFVVADVLDGHIFLVFAGADTQERHAVAVVRVHVRLNFEDEAGEVVRVRIDSALVSFAAGWAWRDLQEALEERFDTEVRDGGTEVDGRELAAEDFLLVIGVSCNIQQLDFCLKVGESRVADGFSHFIVIGLGGLDLHHTGSVVAGGRVEEEYLVLFAAVNALEVAVGSDGPVHRGGTNAEYVFEFFEQVEGVLRGTVHLVDECEYRNAPLAANGEELDCLGLNTLRAVKEHDSCVGCTEGSVCVFGEVLMSGGIKDVDTVVVVVELHDGGGDGDTALFLNLHPVRSGVARSFSRFDGTGHVDCTAVQEELLGDGCFSGVRMGDDGEGLSLLDLFGNGCVHRIGILSCWLRTMYLNRKIISCPRGRKIVYNILKRADTL